MKTFNKDKELLSAYIDGELSPKEKEYIEEKISSSLQLQKELADIKQLKKVTSSAYDRIAEAPFFQTRLNLELNSPKPFLSKIKRWIPAASITVVTVFLLISLKLNPDLIKNIIEEQTTNLANLYKDNLQPLLYAANLTNEDIFNFAFYSELPLDTTNEHILRLGYDSTGSEYFEIKRADTPVKENNLEKFVQALALDEIQKREINSIISSYSDDLMSQVLVSDRNAVAINPNLWNYQKVIAAEILAYAKSKNERVYSSIIPSGIRPPERIQVSEFVRDLRPAHEEKYIFFTPDSIFTDDLKIDEMAFKRDMMKMEKDLERMNKEIERMNFQIRIDTTFKRLQKDSIWQKGFTVFADTNKFTVKIPAIVLKRMNIPLPNMDSINTIIQDALKNVDKLSIKIPDHKSGRKEFKIEIQNGDSSKFKYYQFNDTMIDSILRDQHFNLDSLQKFNFNPFEFFNDSTSRGLDFFLNDSSFFDINKDLRKQMQELKEELRKFREEMKYFQVEPPVSPDSIKPKKKYIEI